MKVFVLLAANLDAFRWKADFREGKVPDAAPYGYNYAEEFGCEVVFSKPTERSLIARGFDYLIRRLIGFELTHAFRNLTFLAESGADIIWTHTEREFLPLLFLQAVLPAKARPVIAQSVWLADDWANKPILHRALAKWLCSRAAACTFLSPLNTGWAKTLGLCSRVELVLFGVSDQSFKLTSPSAAPKDSAEPIRVLALGNDKHRDWPTFKKAFLGDTRFSVRIASKTFTGPAQGINWMARQCSLAELREWYSWCDVVVIPLIGNLHASGLTTLIEATLLGKPIVVTNVGGLDAYLGGGSVIQTLEGDASGLSEAVRALMAANEQVVRMVRHAQSIVQENALTSRGFALRHVELSREILGLQQ